MLLIRMPDIILMDLSMPDMDGIEAAKIAAERFPDISIVVLTSYSDQELRLFSLLKRFSTGGRLTDNFNVFLSGEEIAQSFADNCAPIARRGRHESAG
jgi:CheY-like chemotaxis protein